LEVYIKRIAHPELGALKEEGDWESGTGTMSLRYILLVDANIINKLFRVQFLSVEAK